MAGAAGAGTEAALAVHVVHCGWCGLDIDRWQARHCIHNAAGATLLGAVFCSGGCADAAVADNARLHGDTPAAAKEPPCGVCHGDRRVGDDIPCPQCGDIMYPGRPYAPKRER